QSALRRGNWADPGPCHRAAENRGRATSVIGVALAGQADRAALRVWLGGNHAAKLRASGSSHAARLPVSVQDLNMPMQSVPTVGPPRERWFTFHPLSTRDHTVMDALRTLVEPSKGKLRGPEARAPFDGIMGRTSAPEGVTFRQDQRGAIPGWWCEPAD